ncbi:MAG: tRNA (N(6)-L-threonylcarbamoyladenosine(37)-C(2))-methylthiotransferase MtaB [Firmicutes bacterium HGW-Firmicutes-12]|jgi:threonylcarbamoyladenosine tRNA methylthiotransferase MtaB|nr:MAG: tRNA (N(6)-L-threonylcarbamoyladenosine(37)-C(2))-methylthiotransferase MtaB [Firmicutes bacterium HGW-Firmicutes-12]
MNNKTPRIALYTLGCKVNQNETDAIAALFEAKGYDIVEFEEIADIYVLNTCTVTHLADRKSRQIIRRCTKRNPQAKVVVTGCYAQMAPQDIERIPGVNLIIGTTGKNRIVDLVEEIEKDRNTLNYVEDLQENSFFEEIETASIMGRARAYLKVQDGCEQFCTYCIIPYARGNVRSRTLDSTLQEADRLIGLGFREIVLTGIHLGFYGRDISKDINLEILLAKLLSINKNVRWRLSSLEPMELSDRMLELMKTNANFCPHLHLPLQAAHNDILQSMNRPYTIEEYRQVLERAKKAVPDIAITTDIMLGFPGETISQFEDYLEFIEEMAFSGMHVFKYSPRKGTPAATYPDQISADIKEKRSHQVRCLADRLELEYAKRFIGRVLSVLAEKEIEEGIWEGHSENYLKVRFFSNSVKRGEIAPVELKEVRKGLYLGTSY